MRKHRHTIPLTLILSGEGRDFDVDVIYTITPGRPEVGPAYDHGGLPADPPEITVLSARLASDAERLPEWFCRAIEDNEAAFTALGEAAEWGHEGLDPDELRDRRDELMRADR